MDYKELIFNHHMTMDQRPWKLEECSCGRNPCYSSLIVPVCPENNKDYISGAGDITTNDAEFLVLTHNIIPSWMKGQDRTEDWAKLRELDEKVGPKVKWRYQHCFAVRRKKFNQKDCWCRVIVAVGVVGNNRYVVDAAQLGKNEAILMTFMHNYLLG